MSNEKIRVVPRVLEEGQPVCSKAAEDLAQVDRHKGDIQPVRDGCPGGVHIVVRRGEHRDVDHKHCIAYRLEGFVVGQEKEGASDGGLGQDVRGVGPRPFKMHLEVFPVLLERCGHCSALHLAQVIQEHSEEEWAERQSGDDEEADEIEPDLPYGGLKSSLF